MVERIETLVVGGGQAGIAMSAHLKRLGLGHVVVERGRLAERWREERWDSLVANGPAWHDRFPDLTIEGVDPDGFATRAEMVAYFERYAAQFAAPVRCGVTVKRICREGAGFRVESSAGMMEARNVVVATGPFQAPAVPGWVPEGSGVVQVHSSRYRNPGQLPAGGVLVVGAGSSGVQIADELLRAGRAVTLSVGPHNRPPRRYRGRDFVWWLGVLGKWEAVTHAPGREHVTIAVSGARGGTTVDFRELASRGMRLVGRAEGYADGVMRFAGDLADNVALGDADYLSVLDEADAYAAREGLALPEDAGARAFEPGLPAGYVAPGKIRLAAEGIGAIVWATGYRFEFGWLEAGEFDGRGHPVHRRGVSPVPGLYHLGLPWLSRRASAFIWGVWRDAAFLAEQIAARA